jgi:hypothetical protein
MNAKFQQLYVQIQSRGNPALMLCAIVPRTIKNTDLTKDTSHCIH